MVKAPWMVLGAATLLAPLLPTSPTPAAPRQPWPAPPPLLAPASDRAAATTPWPGSGQRGDRLRIHGRTQRAAWLLQAGPGRVEGPLWLPLEVWQGQIGVSSRSLADGSLELEWYGRRLLVPPGEQRPLDDEVAVDGAPLLRDSGITITVSGDTLMLDLPPPRLLAVRSSASPGGGRRIVLDLEAPALLRSQAGGAALALASGPDQLRQLESFGLRWHQRPGDLQLRLPPAAGQGRWFTLGEPARIVIELPAPAPTAASPSAADESRSLDPRLQALLGRSLVWERRQLQLGGQRFRLNAISLDPRTAPLELRTLSAEGGMEGLSLLPNLARRWDALVAINGGFFNRIRRLPLGALRDRGRWLSGPILNRGAIGWESGELPRFGRLRLQEWLIDANGGRWPLVALNSGYVQRGLSRYTADWGPGYRSLSEGETAVLLRAGMVVQRLEAARLAAGVALGSGDELVVGRAGSVLPWREGERLQLVSQPSEALGGAANVIGGGPLLLQDGRVVLQAVDEGFSSAFLSQGAPRSVIASDGRRLLLLTLQGIDRAGPTLAETARLLLDLGLRDALNLDGGSSTALVIGGSQAVLGRGVTAAVHHGLGLVLRRGSRPLSPLPTALGEVHRPPLAADGS
ncbi:MAG: phosphodiester glycosidase family protein [Synechococcus sp.]|nr:phosphodiester glycosidase family protein [Synechococcus sp.]